MNSTYHFQFEVYQRNFKKPLQTSHGLWRVREGIILSLRDSEGKLAQGEIAPIPWFGSETLSEAIQFCQQREGVITSQEIKTIPDSLPACQYGFESALLAFVEESVSSPNYLDFCYLLPSGVQALNHDFLAQNSSAQNFQAATTYKWKIGIAEASEEIAIAKKLIFQLPNNAKLRLDANGGLSLAEAKAWLDFADNQSTIEFIEQPLPPEQFAQMLELNRAYRTALALDESVATLGQLKHCYRLGWRDIFVIKPGIMGYPSQLRSFCQQYQLDLVFSSVLETDIGLRMALQLAAELGNRQRAMGFGVQHWFGDSAESDK